MLVTLVIGLREGLEAALIVAIIATFLNRARASLRPMWWGVGAAVALSLAVGVTLELVAVSLDQTAQEALEAVIGVAAASMVTAMVLWMARHSRSMKSDLERAASEVAFLHQGKLLMRCSVDETKERYARLWLPARMSAAAPNASLSRRRHEDGSLSLVVERDAQGQWPQAAQLAGARVDALGLEDLFVELAE